MLQQTNAIRTHAYRADIDGLRAIAVVAVVIFHAFPHALRGGFLGVDIFFVISGFLITNIIQRQCETGNFSFLDFYRRRVRRIYPALTLVLVVTVATSVFVYWGNEAQSVSWHAFGAALFLPNVFLWNEAGYFDAAAQTKPLLHLWSLGIEEQFYIAWPLLVWTSFRRAWHLPTVLGVVAAASFAFSVYLSGYDPTAAFYSPFSRAWELSAGGLLAAWRYNAPARKLSNFFAGIGVAFVLGSVLIVKEANFSTWIAIFPVAGALLLIASGQGSVISSRALATKPMVAIGLVSYPFYLWHWPMLVLGRVADPNLSKLATLLIVALSAALAVATFALIERPIHRTQPLRRVSLQLFSMMAMIAIASFAGSRFDIRIFLYPTELNPILNYAHYDYKSDARIGKCWINPTDKNQTFASECGFGNDRPDVKLAIWGDSHSGRLYPGCALRQPQI